jgi:o-succinylbenzoate synthase
MADVRIAAARLTNVRLPLRRPLATTRGLLAERSGVVLEVEAEGGARGWGEALPLAGFGLESRDEARRALHEIARELVGREPGEIDELLDTIEHCWPNAPAARAAADVALHDLAARLHACSLAAWLARRRGIRPRGCVAVNALLSAPDPAGVAHEARDAVARGFRTLKLKLGALDFGNELARVAAVRDAAGPEVALRLDAGGAWQEAQAAARLDALAVFGIELLEQPLAAGELAGLARLREKAPMPIAADEAVRDEEQARRLLDAGAADLFVLKPAALGGLRATARIAARARAAGVGCVVTGLLDSAVGRTAALQLTAVLPDEGFAAGLATDDLLTRDLAPGARFEAGTLALPEGPGLGLTVTIAALRTCAVGPTQELRA